MVERGTEFAYDVFISYSHADQEWVRGWLVPRLKEAGLDVCTDRESFDVGVPALVNMENAATTSRHTLLVLTPAWVESGWTEFEALLTQTTDPAGRRRRVLPLLLKPCQLPPRIAILTYADFTQSAEWENQLQRLIAGVRGEPRQPEVGVLSHAQYVQLEQALHRYPDLQDILEKGDFEPSITRTENRLTVIRPKVAIVCVLPLAFGEGSCQIEFSNVTRRGLTIHLTHRNILGDLIMGLHTSPHWPTRRFLRELDDGVFEAKLGQTTTTLSEGEANDLCACVDEVCQEYKRIIIEAETVLETQDYEPMQTEHIQGHRLLSVRQWLWESMKQFAYEFDYGHGNSDWHIFDWNYTSIRVSRGMYNYAFVWPKTDIAPDSFLPTGYVHLLYGVPEWHILEWVNREGVVSWKEVVGPRGIWTARYTKKWMVEDFIPKARAHYAQDFQAHKLEPDSDILDAYQIKRISLQEVSEPRQLETYLREVQYWLSLSSLWVSTSLLRPYYAAFTDLAHSADPSTVGIHYNTENLWAVEAKIEHTQGKPGSRKSPSKWTYDDVMNSLDQHVARINHSEYEDSSNADLISRVFISIVVGGTINFSQSQLNAAKWALLPLWEQSRFETRYVFPNRQRV